MKSLLEQIFDLVTQLPQKKTFDYLRRIISLKIRNIAVAAGRIAPKLARSSPLLGPAAEYVTKEILLKDIAKLEENEKRLLATTIAWLKLVSKEKLLIILIEDFHDLDAVASRLLGNIISSTLSTLGARARFILVSRPIDSSLGEDAYHLMTQLGRNAILARIHLAPLDDHHLKQICDDIFSNPGECEGIIRISDGNPQSLLECLAKVNLQGGIRKEGELIVLDSEGEGVTDFLTFDIWNALSGQPKARRLLGVLAMNTGPVSKARIKFIQDATELQEAETSLLISDLCATQLLEWIEIHHQSSQVDLLRFRHASIREQIAQKLKRRSPFDYSECNRICAQYLTSYIESHSPGLLREIRGLTDVKSSVNSGLFENLNDIICLAKNLRDSHSANWESLAFGCARVCLVAGLDVDVIDLATGVMESWRDSIQHNSDIWRWLLRAVVRSHYRLGHYRNCIAIDLSDDGLDTESRYYIAASEALVKKDVGYLERVQEIVSSSEIRNSQDRKYYSLMVSIEALSLQESGKYKGAENVYRSHLKELGKSIDESMEFRILSPLFLNSPKSNENCRRAERHFLSIKDSRLGGMAANNLGYALLGEGRHEDALQKFSLSQNLLQHWPHEAVFPLNNSAFVSIASENFSEAYNILKECLFRIMSPYHEVVVQINLAYCRWGLGMKSDFTALDSVFGSGGLVTDSWLEWQVLYVKAVAGLKSKDGEPPDDDDVMSFYLRIKALSRMDAAAPYWNMLVESIFPKGGNSRWLLPTGKPPTTMAAISTSSAVRPAALCFGHL